MTSLVPGAQALKDMANQIDDDQSDAQEESLKRASTVVLIRDGATGVEVLMLRRPERGSFSGAWVFPGGKVDDADDHGAEDETPDVVYAAIRETKEETNLDVTANDLIPLSVWDPPRTAPFRIRTWFYCATSHAGELIPQASEVDEVLWITAANMLSRHAAGEVTLYPPTFVTLESLKAADTVAELSARLSATPVREFHTNLRKTNGVAYFRWQGDYEYDIDQPVTHGKRHRLVAGDVPWEYVRD